MGAHNIKAKMLQKAYPEDHISDPAACAAMTHAVGTGADATTPSGAEYNQARADLDALKTAVDNLNTAIDSILAVQAAWGLTKSS
jgi:hypothetical protein